MADQDKRKAQLAGLAQPLLEEADDLLREAGAAPTEAHIEAERLAQALRAAVDSGDEQAVDAAAQKFDEHMRVHFGAFRMKRAGKDWGMSIILAVFIAVTLRVFVFEPFKIPSGSMYPVLHVGDHIFVNKLVYGPRIPWTYSRVYNGAAPKAGDVIVFEFPGNPALDYIKRVIGTPGDRIRISGREIYLNGERLPLTGGEIYSETGGDAMRYNQSIGGHSFSVLYDPHSAGSIERPCIKRLTGRPEEDDGCFCVNVECVVPDGHYFVMGDNRDRSADSRKWGFVPAENIKGRAMFVWMNWQRWDTPPSLSRLGHWID